MTIYLKDDIGANLITRLLHYINKLEEKENMVVYLNTTGGEIDDMELILEVLDKYKDRIHLIACGKIFSAGFDIFFKANCTKSIAKGTKGMSHFAWAEIEVDQSGRPKTEYAKFLLKTMKDAKKEAIDFLKEVGLSSKELNKVKKGEEVYFTETRLRELLKKQDGQIKE